MTFLYAVIIGLALFAAKSIMDVRRLSRRYNELLKERAALQRPLDVDPA